MRRAALLFLLCSAPVLAATAVEAPPSAPSSLMGLIQVVLGLSVVLAAIFGCAWLFRRMSNSMIGIPRHLRVVSAVMVGQRERVVIVEMGDEWLVLGVTGQSVNLLSTRAKPPMDESQSLQTPVEPFARWLKAALERRRGSSDDLKQ